MNRMCWHSASLVLLLLCIGFDLLGALDYANLELYREGYDELNLPILATLGDTVRLPFRTDTNRYSDGFTSSTPFSVSSPSFPQYKGFLASPEGRQEGYLAYNESCAAQGLALYGAGDAEKEVALRNALLRPNYRNETHKKEFSVYASIKWNPSHFCIQKDEDYYIEVVGDQMWQDGGIRVGPSGYESNYDATSNCYTALGRCRSHLKKKRRILNAPWMSLACAVGEFVRPLQEANPNNKNDTINYLPLDEAILQETMFSVGRSKLLTRVAHTGQLICFANDAQLNYWNNVGSMTVTVTRVSWPPKVKIEDLYYEPLRKPACDAAIMVYKHQGNYTAALEYCNPFGGGAGWKPGDVTNVDSRYGSQVDQSFYLPEVLDRTTVKPPMDIYTSPYESMF